MGNTKTYRRNRIRQRIKKVISGTSDFPRLSVFRSNKEIYCQLIDDVSGKTLMQSSSRDKSITDLKLETNMDVSFNVGKILAEKAVKKGIKKIKFDRGGYLYHGRVKSLAEDAKKNLVRIPIDNGTLPHEQKGKFGGAKVFIKPATEGTGVIAGGAVRTVLEAVGVQNVLSKSQGSSNPHNVVKATFDALLNLRSPLMISKQRGISLNKVFKG
jgi:ribosomal protein L18